MDARDAIERLCEFEDRAACTDAERRAAAWLHDRLRADGHEAWVETRWVRPQRWATVVLAAATAAGGSLVSVAVPVAGAAAAGAAAVVLAFEAFGRVSPVRMLFARRATQHVLTEAAGSGVAEARDVTLIIAAAYDAPRRGAIFAARWRRLARTVRSPLGWLAGCAALVTAAAGARAAGVDATWLGIAQLLPTAVLIVAVAAAIDVALSPASPGANESASAAALALALHAALVRDPPARVAPALLLHGAASAAPEALRRHLRGERLDPRAAVVLAVRPCGAGTPAWASRHPQLRALDVRASGPRPTPPAATGSLPALALGCLDERGVVPRAHQADDLPEHVDDAALAGALALALDLVDALDATLA